VDGSGPGSHSVAGFGITDIGSSGSAIKVVSFFGGLDYDTFCIAGDTASNFRMINFK
jgi:hypothetical protein